MELIRFPIIDSASNMYIEGNLVIPDNPIGIVIFSHGSGSSKNSKRNQLVSEKLNNNNIATLLLDLLSDEEQKFDSQVNKMSFKVPGARLNKFNITLLTKRLSMVTDWVRNNPRTKNLLVGYFASSTGATAGLISASRYNIVSIVIRSGRTDLVENTFLDKIESPCLFLVGSKEKDLLMISNKTMRKMRNSKEKKLHIVEGASHLFEEEGTIEEVSVIASQWMAHNFMLVGNLEEDK